MPDTSTHTVAQDRPQAPVQRQDDVWTPSVAIALAALFFTLFAGFLRLHFRAVKTEGNAKEALDTTKANKVRIEALETKAHLHSELQTRNDRLLEKIEDKLDRLYELLTAKK